MNRRRFLASAAATSLLAGGALWRRPARADLPAPAQPLLVHVMLLGGPDFRHLLPPRFDSTAGGFGRAFHGARAATFGVADTIDALASYTNQHYEGLDDSSPFALLRGCEFLRDFWRDGHVAMVHNVVGATSRDHEHAQRVWESADRALAQVDAPRSGWGGRLATATNSAVLSLTATPRPFCLAPGPNGTSSPSAARIVTLDDPVSIGLYRPPLTAEPVEHGIDRALRQYYPARSTGVPADAAARGFFEHEASLRGLGDRLRPRFDALTLPAQFSALLAGESALATRPLAMQLRNLYYGLAATDLVDFRAASLAFGNWDSHDLQASEIEPKLRDLFGDRGALATLYALLPDAVSRQIVWMFSGEFGRQLRGNGDRGTDHGTGNSVLLLGYPVRGGSYGEPFPAAELARLQQPTPDISGATDLDALLAPLVDYLAPGARSSVLPAIASARTEAGVTLTNLFTTT